LSGKYVVNTTFKGLSPSHSFLGKFSLDTEVLDIRNKDVILDLSWLTENGFGIDTQDRCQRNTSLGLFLPCSIRWIPSVTVLDMESEPLKDGGVLQIIEASEHYLHYAQYFSIPQAARLPEHKSWDHEIPLQEPQAKTPIGAIYKITWEEDEALKQYLKKELPTRKVCQCHSAAGAPILFVRKKDGSLRICVYYRALTVSLYQTNTHYL